MKYPTPIMSIGIKSLSYNILQLILRPIPDDKRVTELVLKSGQVVMRRAFSLIELIIVTAVLGILAAIVLPTFQGHMTKAKEVQAKENLQILRSAIELYAARHNDIPPGYTSGDPSKSGTAMAFDQQLITSGDYLVKRPENPYSGLNAIRVLDNDEEYPTEPYMVDTFGWLYKPATRTIKLNWSGTDSEGVAYFDY